jgi:hypothetical protein
MKKHARFGRLYIPDPRDAKYPIRQCLAKLQKKRMPIRRLWRDDFWTGDQGDLPACVGYSWTGWLEAAPVRPITTKSPCINPVLVYKEAQKVDEWPGENYQGTSVRAGAKVLQSRGYIKSYHWALVIQDIIQAVLMLGPVVVGTDWYAQMSDLRPGNIMRARGELLGGHAYLLSGADRRRKLFRVRNSWGLNWGKKGRAVIPFNDMARLLQAQGEACLAIEIPKEG